MLKAYLTKHQVDFIKTHSLSYLLNLCSKIDSSFDKYKEKVASLMPYAVDVRYPDDFINPDEDEAKLALQSAKTIIAFVKTKL